MPDEEMKVIRLLGVILEGVRTPFDGQFVVDYDPSRAGVMVGGMNIHLVTTPDQAKATRYTTEDAFELYRKVDQRNPVRPDGKLNRPLTAFSIETLPAEGEPMAPTMEELGL